MLNLVIGLVLGFAISAAAFALMLYLFQPLAETRVNLLLKELHVKTRAALSVRLVLWQIATMGGGDRARDATRSAQRLFDL